MTYRKDLEPAVQRAEEKILRIVRAKVPDARLDRIGPIESGGPGSGGPTWSCWVITSSDAEKNLLEGDAALASELQSAAAEVGLAPKSITVQSQETVDRDFEGSWFHAMR